MDARKTSTMRPLVLIADDHRAGTAEQLKSLFPLLVVLFVLLVLALPAAAQQNAKHVLVLSGGHGHESIDLMKATLRPRVPWPVNFTVLDLENPFEAESFREGEAEALRSLPSPQKPDLVIAVMDRSLFFALQYRDKAFPGVPIVFMSVGTPSLADHESWHGVSGVACASGIPETIDLALRLHPDTNAIAVITDLSQWERNYFAAVHSELLRHQDRVKEIDLIGPPSSELLDKVAALPPHTVVLFELIPQDASQPVIGVFDVLAAVSQRLPTYSVFAQLSLGHGGIGGAYYDATKDAVLTGEIAARVLSGERPDDIPFAQDSPAQVTVDWRALQRWHVPDSALPPGTLVLNREPTLWQRGSKYFLVGTAVIVVQAFLIFGLLWQRARKRKAEAILRESEKRFRVMADTTPSLIWMCDDQGKVIYLNEQRVSFTGSDPHAGYGDTWRAYVHPDDLKSILGTFSNALKSHQPFSNQYRLRRRDGVYRWIFDIASPRVNGDGSFAGFIGSAVDVTDQKLAQEALEKVSGQLIEAQERERTRLARELHDDICQRLAMLSIKIEKATNGVRRGQRSVADQLELIWQQCSDLTGDVQALSHELHPSILDNLGLATAVKSFCGEVSKQNGVVVEFAGKDIPNSLPREISLSLFRVIQEAIHNALKHSGGKQFEVRLEAKSREIELEVSDRGVGFDPTGIKNGGGLGLVSMAERIHQVDGTLTIDSQLNIGTRIRVRVPLAPQSKIITSGAN